MRSSGTTRGKGKLRWLLLAVLPAVVLPAGSAVAASSYKAIGSGNLSCGSWTSARTQVQGGGDQSAKWLELTYSDWVLGFLSGVGYAGAANNQDPVQGLDAKAVEAWLDQYCQTHPLKDLADAAVAFVDEHPRGLRVGGLNSLR